MCGSLVIHPGADPVLLELLLGELGKGGGGWLGERLRLMRRAAAAGLVAVVLVTEPLLLLLSEPLLDEGPAIACLDPVVSGMGSRDIGGRGLFPPANSGLAVAGLEDGVAGGVGVACVESRAEERKRPPLAVCSMGGRDPGRGGARSRERVALCHQPRAEGARLVGQLSPPRVQRGEDGRVGNQRLCTGLGPRTRGRNERRAGRRRRGCCGRRRPSPPFLPHCTCVRRPRRRRVLAERPVCNRNRRRRRLGRPPRVRPSRSRRPFGRSHRIAIESVLVPVSSQRFCRICRHCGGGGGGEK